MDDREEITGVNSSSTAETPVGQSNPLNSLDPVSNRAARFSGNGRMVIPPQDKYATKSWSVEMWVKPDCGSNGGVLATRRLYDRVLPQSAISWEMGVQSSGALFRPYVKYSITVNGLETQVRVDGAQPGEIMEPGCTPLIPCNTWTHLAGTFDRDTQTLSLYINGELRSHIVSASQAPVLNFGPSQVYCDDEVTIGAERSVGAITGGYEGYLDELAYVPRALTAGELGQGYTSPIVGKITSISAVPFRLGAEIPAEGMADTLAGKANDAVVYAMVQFDTDTQGNLDENLASSGLAVQAELGGRAFVVKGTKAQIAATQGLRHSGFVDAKHKLAPGLAMPVAQGTKRAVIVQVPCWTARGLSSP